MKLTLFSPTYIIKTCVVKSVIMNTPTFVGVFVFAFTDTNNFLNANSENPISCETSGLVPKCQFKKRRFLLLLLKVKTYIMKGTKVLTLGARR